MEERGGRTKEKDREGSWYNRCSSPRSGAGRQFHFSALPASSSNSTNTAGAEVKGSTTDGERGGAAEEEDSREDGRAISRCSLSFDASSCAPLARSKWP